MIIIKYSISSEGRGRVATDAGETIIINTRHYDELPNIYTSIQDVIKGLDADLPGDLLSLDIRRCLVI